VQGVVQALMGGINDAVSKGAMTATEAVAARTFARVVGSAIRTAASPGDPGQAFASAFLDDVFKQIDTTAPVTQSAFDDEGRLNLGIVDANASPEQQAQQLAAQLQRQGIPAAQANLMAQQALGNIVDGVAQLPQRPVQTAPTQPAPVTQTEPNSPGGTTTPPTTTTPNRCGSPPTVALSCRLRALNPSAHFVRSQAINPPSPTPVCCQQAHK
jgi:hypothetical protein